MAIDSRHAPEIVRNSKENNTKKRKGVYIPCANTFRRRIQPIQAKKEKPFTPSQSKARCKEPNTNPSREGENIINPPSLHVKM